LPAAGPVASGGRSGSSVQGCSTSFGESEAMIWPLVRRSGAEAGSLASVAKPLMWSRWRWVATTAKGAPRTRRSTSSATRCMWTASLSLPAGRSVVPKSTSTCRSPAAERTVNSQQSPKPTW
jgi:hypothetical protein